MRSELSAITNAIIERSRKSREAYLASIAERITQAPHRKQISCGNLAHGFAACPVDDKHALKDGVEANIAIVSAYNDMLSAHQPYVRYPDQIKHAIREAGGIAQFAGGVPAMCDGITQGQPGMELSLMSRDVIALSAAIALSHNMFDGGIMLGICDKIVPGLVLAALAFGELPFIFIPSGPMPSGISHVEKNRVRQRYAEGKANEADLLEAEAASYHAPGTCTFYGTANSNQLLMEIMGLQLPGSSFEPPDTPLRNALTIHAARRVLQLSRPGPEFLPVGRLLDEKSFVNAMVGLLATGGSTNHTLHLVAMARKCGVLIEWEDFAKLSALTPLVARIYPNGYKDINAFHLAGGMSLLIRTLLDSGLLHQDVQTVAGFGLERYTQKPSIVGGELIWEEGATKSSDEQVLASVQKPFAEHGGLQIMHGNLGTAVLKVSAVKPEKRIVEGPAFVFDSQESFIEAFRAGNLDKDCVIVLRFQGPKACGMPELHGLMPSLSVLQDKGYNVALVTDGRLSGASGKVPAAIHVTPEAASGGRLACVQDGDTVMVDGQNGRLQVMVPEIVFNGREPAVHLPFPASGMGREMFSGLRSLMQGADKGASFLFFEGVENNE